MNDPEDFEDFPQDEIEEAPAPPPGPQLPTVDGLPDQQEYRDWTHETTRVVSGPIGAANFPGQRFISRAAARVHWKQRAGRIYEDHYIPGRWCFRVRKDA